MERISPMLLCHLSSLQDCAQCQQATIFYLTKQVSFLAEVPTCTFLRCALYLIIDSRSFRESRIHVADFQRQCCSYSQPISSSAEFLSVMYHVSCQLEMQEYFFPPEQMVWSFPPKKRQTCFGAAEMLHSKNCRDSSKYTNNHSKSSPGNFHPYPTIIVLKFW